MVELRTRTHTSGILSIIFQQIFKLFPAIFQDFYDLVCSKTEKDILNQNKMIQNRKGCSKARKDNENVAFSGNFVPKSLQKVAKVLWHIARP